MSFCEFDEDNGEKTFRCARMATHRIVVSQDPFDNEPYELLYCPEHAAFYLEGGVSSGPDHRSRQAVFTVVELPRPYAVRDVAGDDDG